MLINKELRHLLFCLKQLLGDLIFYLIHTSVSIRLHKDGLNKLNFVNVFLIIITLLKISELTYNVTAINECGFERYIMVVFAISIIYLLWPKLEIHFILQVSIFPCKSLIQCLSIVYMVSYTVNSDENGKNYNFKHVFRLSSTLSIFSV